MKGTRPLDNDEIRSVSTCFTDTLRFENGLTHREHLTTCKSQQVMKNPGC